MGSTLIQHATGANATGGGIEPYTVNSGNVSFSSPTSAGSLLIMVFHYRVFGTGGFGGDTTGGRAWTSTAQGLDWKPLASGLADNFLGATVGGSATSTESYGVYALYALNVPAGLTGPFNGIGQSNGSGNTKSDSVDVDIYEFGGIYTGLDTGSFGTTNSVVERSGLFRNARTGHWTASDPALTTTDTTLLFSVAAKIGVDAGLVTYTNDQPAGTINANVFGLTDSEPTYYNGFTVFIREGTVVATAGPDSCGSCSGRLLEIIPGFSDLPDDQLATGLPSFALHLGEVAMNATFGMVRCEIFPCTYKHGDTVALPKSCWDGYQYSREELLYLWVPQKSVDPSTNWISGPDCLWFMNWNVNQTTGEVFSEEWYERSAAAGDQLAAKSNDGSILVYTIGQRQKTNMIMTAPAVYNSISESQFATDKPVTQQVMQQLNQNAKFSCVNNEIFYLGEYISGQTVQVPTSPVDGYTYSTSECKFFLCWRWTASESNYVQPPSSTFGGVFGGGGDYQQAGPFSCSIDASGLVTITVLYVGGSGNAAVASGYGRVAAFAFCTRSATTGPGSTANHFAEIDLDFFGPGREVRASELLQIKRNCDEAILSPEFFGPTVYQDGDTIPTPVSSDGYAYTRSEIQYIWNWTDTTNQTGSHLRLPLFVGSIDVITGKVSLKVWRLPPGGPFVDDNNTLCSITVIVMAMRKTTQPELILGTTDGNAPSGATTTFSADTSVITVNGA